MKLKWPKSVHATNVHGIYIASLLPMTVDAIHKSIFVLMGADASDAVKIEAIKALTEMARQPRTISGCEIKIG